MGKDVFEDRMNIHGICVFVLSFLYTNEYYLIDRPVEFITLFREQRTDWGYLWFKILFMKLSFIFYTKK